MPARHTPHWRRGRGWGRRDSKRAVPGETACKGWGWTLCAAGLRLFHGALKRIKATSQQVGLSKTERATNMQGAFAMSSKVEVVGRRLVLIDDVLTSGATSEACARVLLRAGAANVDVLVFARVVDPVRTPI